MSINRRTALGFLFASTAMTVAPKATAGPMRLLHKGRVAASIAYITPGSTTTTDTTVASAWAADTYSTAEGTALQEGYTSPPSGAVWACERFQESVSGSDVWIGVVASGTPSLASYAGVDAFCNMKKVSIAIGGGAYVDQTAASAHPVTGRVAFWLRVKSTDLPGGAASGLYEVRARCIPKVGQPYLLQGADPGGGSPTLNTQAAFSNYVVLDKGDLARQTIYKAPNDGTADGSDAHAGTVGDPCVTWKKARQLQVAHGSYPSVLTTHYLTNGAHEWGISGSTDDLPVESTIGWTRILPAPAATVSITSFRGPAQSAVPATLNATQGGRIPWRKFYFSGFDLGNVSIDNTYFVPASGGADGSYNNVGLGINTGFHSHAEAITTASRPTTLGSSGTLLNQPLNTDWFNHGNHCLTVEFANLNIGYAATAGLYQSTYLRDIVLNHIANYADVADNCRYVAGLHPFNISEFNQGQHLDLIQPTVTPAPNGPSWFEDLFALSADGWTGQFILGDSGHMYQNTVFLRIAADPQHSYTVASAQNNNRVLWPNTAGGSVEHWNVINANSLLTSPTSNTWYLFNDTGAGLGDHEIFYRQGVKKLYSFTTQMPPVNTANPVSPIEALVGAGVDIVNLIDLDVSEFALRTNRTAGFAPTFYGGGVIKIRGCIDAHNPQLPTKTNPALGAKGNGLALDNTAGSKALMVLQDTDAARPVNVEGSHRHARFLKASSQWMSGKIFPLVQAMATVNNDTITWSGSVAAQAGTVLSINEVTLGSKLIAAGAFLTDYSVLPSNPVSVTISSQTSGVTGKEGVYQISSSALVPAAGTSWGIVEFTHPRSQQMTVFMALNIVADASTAAAFFLHTGRGDLGATYIGRQVVSGTHRLVANTGKTNGTATFNALTTPGGAPAIEGNTVICVEVLSDRLRLTYWNANTSGVASNTADNGYQVDALFGGGYTPNHTLYSAQVMTFGATSNYSTAPVSGFTSMDLNATVITSLMDATSRAAVRDNLKARYALS